MCIAALLLALKGSGVNIPQPWGVHLVATCKGLEKQVGNSGSVICPSLLQAALKTGFLELGFCVLLENLVS